MTKEEKKLDKQEFKNEIKQTKLELKNLDKEYKLQLKKKKLEVVDFNKNNKDIKKAPKIVEGQVYNVPFILKFALTIAKIIAIVESIFFLPFAWSIWFFNRYNSFYNGITIENKRKIGINALIFYGIIPGIIILAVKVREK